MDTTNYLMNQFIYFHTKEVSILSRPHDDALVISLNVANFLNRRMFVDNESSANVPFLLVLKEMEINESEIEREKTVLVGFNGH